MTAIKKKLIRDWSGFGLINLRSAKSIADTENKGANGGFVATISS